VSDDQSEDTLYTIDFQRSVLKLMATNLKFAADYGTLLKAEYFDNEPLRTMYSIVSDYVFKYEKEMSLSEAAVEVSNRSQTMGFTDEVFKDLDFEAKSVFNKALKSESFIIDSLLRFVRRQELKSALFKSVEVIEQDGSYESILKMIDQAVSVGSGNDEGMKFDDMLTLPVTYRMRYDPDDLVTTGFPELDKCMEGGMAPGELHVIQAPPKTGKTSFGVAIGAHNVRKGKAVFHISLEVKKEDLAMKYAMNFTKMTKQEICDTDTGTYEDLMKRFRKANPKLFINYWTERTANALTFRSWISRTRAKLGVKPDLIIVDYDDLVLPMNGITESMYDDAGEIYSDLIQLGDYFKCPVLTFAQPQRDAWEWPKEGKLITFDKLAHSAKKAHKCYSILSLNFAEDSDAGILFVDIIRRGESKVKIKIRKDMARSIFIEEGRART
jgi:hypothetical protein